MTRPRVLTVFGTRPEAIKMAPVVRALSADPAIDAKVCVTAQHRGMLDQVLEFFDLHPDHDLDLMEGSQGLADVTGKVLVGVERVIREESPDLVLVHGDTNTTMSSALAAYYQKVAVGHVEAGLRTGNRYAPWPEEMNRRITGALASLHFAPTEAARGNLLREGIDPETVHVTGNTVIDALLWTRDRVAADADSARELEERFSFLASGRRLVLVTGHRRENFGDGVEDMCSALSALAERGDVEILYPVHLNPNVQDPVHRRLDGVERIHLVEPLDYPTFVALMDRAHLILTDSGGVQEEAPSLGVPVLVMREATERPEAVEAGTVRLVGTDTSRIVQEAGRLLDEPDWHDRMQRAHNPYGDGRAAPRIVEVIKRALL